MLQHAARVKDKRVLALVKAFLKAGFLTELGNREDTWIGTQQRASCAHCWPTSPVSVLDEHG
jgi:RNA-directed DNA polymerase